MACESTCWQPMCPHHNSLLLNRQRVIQSHPRWLLSRLKQRPTTYHIVTHSGAFEPFDEGAAQVQRLLKRDRKELTGESSVPDIVKSEFDEAPSTETSTASSTSETAQAKSPFAVAAQPPSPFGGAARSTKQPANPFGGSISQKPFTEPGNVYSDFEPDLDIEDVPWYKSIGLTQVVIALSFLLVIALMVATFFFVLKVGAVRFNE